MRTDIDGLPVKSARQVAQAAVDHGWDFGWIESVHGDGLPFINLHVTRLDRDADHYSLCWRAQTPDGHRYRFFTSYLQPAGARVWVEAPGVRDLLATLAAH